MMNKKTISIAVVLGLVIGGASFFSGRIVQHKASFKQIELDYKHLDALNAAASYNIHADIIAAMNEKKYEKALCLANLVASSKVNDVRQCLADASCLAAVGHEINKISPELSKNGALRIRYYKGGESC
jgi:hypothetical protein